MMSRKFFSVSFLLALSCTLGVFANDLTVKGDATLFKPADEISFTVEVITQEKTAAKALENNNGKMNSVLSAFKQAGLDPSEYSTGSFSIRPVYSERPNDAPSFWRAQIVGYEVTNGLNIKTGKIERAGELLDVATHSGGDNIGSLQFGISDPRKYRAEAIEQASKNAISDAHALAAATGVQLGAPTTVILDDAQKPTPKLQMAYRSMESIPIEPGDIEVRASVTITYELSL